MDPDQCLANLLCAIDSEEREDTLEHLANLETWIRKGGFLPDLAEALRRAGVE